jgi:hypothetical protein
MSLKSVLLFGLLMAGQSVFAQSSGSGSPPPPEDQHHGPHGVPPEAIAACQGKAIGSACLIKTPKGESLAGNCDLSPPPGRRPPPDDGNRPPMDQRPPSDQAMGNAGKPPQPPLACRPSRMPQVDSGKR